MEKINEKKCKFCKRIIVGKSKCNCINPAMFIITRYVINGLNPRIVLFPISTYCFDMYDM